MKSGRWKPNATNGSTSQRSRRPQGGLASRPTLAGVPYLEPDQHVLVADSDDEFAQAIARLLREPLVANTLARNARTLVERRFTWLAVAERYAALYAGLVPSRAVEVAA